MASQLFNRHYDSGKPGFGDRASAHPSQDATLAPGNSRASAGVVAGASPFYCEEYARKERFMAQIIKASGIEISKNERGELLLRLTFRNFGEEAPSEPLYSWMPQWSTIRDLLLAAVVVETINRGSGEEIRKFALAHVGIVADDLQGIMMAQFGIES